jgi:PAS domain S-box-containing protein
VDHDIGAMTALELFEAAPCGYLFTKPDGTIIRVNETFLRWTGYANSDLVERKRFQELLTTPCAIFYETHFAPLLRMQGFVKEITVDVVCANGANLPALVNSAIQVDAVGEPLLVRTTVFDIRERRRYERQLLLERRKADLLTAVVERASDAIITTAPDLTVTTWNRGAETLFGYTHAEALGRNLADLIVPPEKNEEAQQYLLELQAGRTVQYDTTRINKHGERLEVSIMVSANIDPPDDLVGFSAIIRDIGARKQAELALIRAERLASAGRMAAALAHEINNPLAGAINSVFIARTNPDLPEPLRQVLETADAELARVAHVTRQVLGFYRESMKPARVRVAELLDSVVQTIKGRTEAKRIELGKRYGQDLTMMANAGELRHLFSNLLLNSVDATDIGGTIVVRARAISTRTGTRIKVTIADSGIGIPRSVLPRIFEPLFTTKGNSATGLGLWVSKEIVKRHGGTIAVRSRTDKKPTCTIVSLELPVSHDEAPA